MHYILFDPKISKSIYFSNKSDLLDWIQTHSYAISLHMLHRINVYRCPGGFPEFLRIYRSLPQDYFYCSLNNFINQNWLHMYELQLLASDGTVIFSKTIYTTANMDTIAAIATSLDYLFSITSKSKQSWKKKSYWFHSARYSPCHSHLAEVVGKYLVIISLLLV